MNTTILGAASLAALALVPCAGAQNSSVTLYDFNGDPIVAPPPTGAAPGDVLNTFDHTGLSDTDGLAPYIGGNLLASNSDGTVNEVDPSSGNVVNTFPVGDLNDGWLGYDASRSLIITTNASSDRIKGYTPGNSTPVFDIASPTSGPVGATWDPTRDEYAICDWVTDEVVVIDASTLAVVRTLAPGLTRMAGIGYDCVSDTYVVGDRDTSSHYVLNPLTGAVTLSYATATIGGSIPRGHALSTQGGMWAGSWQTTLVVEQETDHAPVADPCGGGGGNLSLRCDPANNHTGGSYVTLANSSESGPGPLHLEASDGPSGEFGYFLVSLGIAEPGAPISNGRLCLTTPIGRYAPAAGGNFNSIGAFDGAGVLQNVAGTSTVGSGYDVLATLPTPPGGAITSGTTYYFQCWYRDGQRSNFSNVLQFQ